jgi:hypothetical protein
MTETVARETQIAEAVAIIRGLLGDRDASKVEVHVTGRGGYRITAEAGEGAVKQTHDWKPR